MKRKAWLCLLLLPIFLLVTGAGLFYWPGWASRIIRLPAAAGFGQFTRDNRARLQLTASLQQKLPSLEKPLNILVVGIDKYASIGGDLRPKPWRADVIILARVDPGRQRVSLLSIPRDTRVNIPGHGMEKIAHAHVYGEMPLTMAVVEELVGIEIEDFVYVDYATFARMVDIIGGIEINVQKELKAKHFHFVPGQQRMNGKQAYEFVTNRNEPMADIARIDRQQLFLRALLENVREQADALDLAKLYLEFTKSSDTSLSLSDTMKLALFARGVKIDEVPMQKLPGSPRYINGISYWIADPEGVQRLRQEMFGVKNVD